MTDEILNLKEAVAFTKIAERTLKKAARSGALNAGLLSNRAGGFRFTKSALIQWVNAGCPTEKEKRHEA
jgi:hypothetical protein